MEQGMEQGCTGMIQQEHLTAAGMAGHPLTKSHQRPYCHVVRRTCRAPLSPPLPGLLPSSQWGPATPGGQRQAPVLGSQVPPFWQRQAWLQLLPKVPAGQAGDGWQRSAGTWGCSHATGAAQQGAAGWQAGSRHSCLWQQAFLPSWG